MKRLLNRKEILILSIELNMKDVGEVYAYSKKLIDMSITCPNCLEIHDAYCASDLSLDLELILKGGKCSRCTHTIRKVYR